MILINSAAYVSTGLNAEFGKLPPCMLPLQNRRLYFHQLKLFSKEEEIVLSLPKCYTLSEYDKTYLEEHNVGIVFVPKDLSLGESIIYTLNVLARFDEPLTILHGDTLIDKAPEGIDLCGIANAEDDYNWSYYEDLDGSYVYAGYFAFASQPLLIRAILEHDFSFIDGVKTYNQSNKLKHIKVSNWLDFGMVNSYYRSKSQMTTQRVFNDLRINSHSVVKYSSDKNKILAEANWFKTIPKELKHFIPALWESGVTNDAKGFYEIEYFYLSSLADLFVFGKNPEFVWKIILKACKEFIDTNAKYTPDNKVEIAKNSLLLYGNKTRLRLTRYCKEWDIDMDHTWCINGKEVPSLNNIVEEISNELSLPNPDNIHILHGDFGFSNILYDFKSQSIKVIDPRGVDMEGKYSIYGDIRYDVAKLAHSVIGMYDFIIGGNYHINIPDDYSMNLHFPLEENIKNVQLYFRTMKFAGQTLEQLKVYPILVHLFLSMLPLHADNPSRQKAMLSNALRLFVEYKNY
ncbi:hypothetical protein BW723_09700 [Polaribacter reichenbachii]|uniref:Capsular biosynthesis protein n=1 Tax=Polaribacter reichenbachii TaxID=996801 RepID=A0A1B8U3B7_9FLAO|nr:hypothetical protein [Polaribacter reichenbachii]APZ46544.1 hypothetical protein BW723_09700 [Polaribacter reichenbachii]AUC17191.1 hypothetical protein BTO17_00150 [Polaribacter reichenbachii]OBY66368.1 hypothetical protein LPB301_06665 [Polaribacter reichenbachii]